MVRQIIRIDEEKCNGCGACARACHEGAIAMVDGKAKLMREDYCDGLGDCLPGCPTGAISFEEREAPAYDAAAVFATKVKKVSTSPAPDTAFRGCPGSMARSIQRREESASAPSLVSSQLSQWPVQIKLVPLRAPYYQGADLLIAADCTAYAYGNFHQEFIRDRVCLIGCPKLDQEDYAEKLTAILRENDIQSVTVSRMEVPCCGGVENAVKRAIQQSGKSLPCRAATISADGRILN